MNHGRWFHGCGNFTNSDGDNVLLVAGGYDDHNTLDSCEILVDNAQRWISISPLLMPIKFHVGASLNNRVFMTGTNENMKNTNPVNLHKGGYADTETGEHLKSIFEYNHGQDLWTVVGEMMTPRDGHAVSVLSLDSYWKFCS